MQTLNVKDSCLSDAQLRALLREEPSPDIGRYEAHLSDCPACRHRLEELAAPAESFAPAPAPAPHPVQLQQAIQHLKVTGETIPVESIVLATPTEPQLRRLADYELLEELGRGGMGIVYRARQLGLRREVALKIILAGRFASSSEVQRFQVEAEAAARLDHPNIVPIFEIGEQEGHHFFSMKLVNGFDLGDAIRRGFVGSAAIGSPENQKRWTAVAQLVATIARAIHYAHQRGVLHRDLKPQNILLDRSGTPHITDFGLAKLAGRDANLTHSAAIMGSPNYMAHEQAAGRAREATTAADIYSIGAILYELLTGRPPFEARSPAETLRLVLECEPTPPKSRNPSVPADLATICLKCLEKDPGRRYGTAEQVAADLDRFCRCEPILARQVTPFERGWRWCRRKPALAASLLALHLVFVFGLCGILWEWWRAERHAHNESRQRQLADAARFRLEFEQAESLLEDGHTARGLAQLARQVAGTPTNRVAAERLLNAITSRAFCLPIAPLTHGPRLNSRAAQAYGRDFPFFFEGPVAAINVSSDGARIVTAGKDGMARIWSAADGALLATLQHGAEVVWADFDSPGRRVVTASMDGTARVWDAQIGRALTPPMQHGGGVWWAAFSHDGQNVVTASDDTTAGIWSAATGHRIGAWFFHRRPVYFAAFTPDDKGILTAERDGSALLWRNTETEPLLVDHRFRKEVGNAIPRYSSAGDLATLDRLGAGLWMPGRPGVGAWHVNAEVLTLQWAKNGRRVVTAAHDGTARVWDPFKGTELGLPFRHQQSVLSVQFSDNDDRLLTASRDRTALLWDVASGLPASEPLHHMDAVFSACFALNGRRVVTGSGAEGAWLWQAPHAAQPNITFSHGAEVEEARFTPGGQVATMSRGSVRVFALNGHEVTRKPISYLVPQGMTDFDFAADLIATVSSHGNTRLWQNDGSPHGQPFQDSAGPKRFMDGPVAAVPGKNGLRAYEALQMVRFSPDRKKFVTASEDGLARLWNPETHRVIHSFSHANRVASAQFKPDGSEIITASWDGTAGIWSADTGLLKGTLPHGHEVQWAAYDPSARFIATAARDKVLRLWSVRSHQLVFQLFHSDTLPERHSFDFNPSGTLIASIAGSSLQVWETGAGKPVVPPTDCGGVLNSVRFSADGRRIVVACNNGSARIIDASTGHTLAEPLRHSAEVTYAEFSSDGHHVLTSSRDGTARLCPMLQVNAPAPAWLPALAEALAGEKLEADNVSKSIPVNRLHEIRKMLISSTATDPYTRWAHQFLQPAP